MHYITDTESYNHYFGWYGGKMEDNGPWLDKFHAMHPSIALGVSEYGCEGIITYHGPEPKCKDYSEDYQALYHELWQRFWTSVPGSGLLMFGTCSTLAVQPVTKAA